MVDNNSSSNPTLTFDQLQAIDESKKRLAIIESEIANANNIIKGIRLENNRVVKEKVYQEELLNTITSQVKEKKAIATKLDEEILDKNGKLNQILVELKEHTNKITADKMEIKDREDKVKSEEEKLVRREQYLVELNTKIEQAEKDFYDKLLKLKEVISTL